MMFSVSKNTLAFLQFTQFAKPHQEEQEEGQQEGKQEGKEEGPQA